MQPRGQTAREDDAASAPLSVPATDASPHTPNTTAPGEPAHGWRRWFSPRNDWTAQHALVPAELGHKVLTLYLGVSAIGMIGAAISLYVHNPGDLRQTAIYWLFFGMVILQLLGAVMRGLAFVVRFILLAATLFGMIVIGAMAVGITPTWVIWTALLVTATALLYGVWASAGAVLLITVCIGAIAWGWVRGYLPILTAPQQTAFFDYHSAGVWVRVIATSGIFTAGLLVLMHFVLSSLRQALSNSTDSLAKLVQEQESRLAVTEALRASESKYSKVYQVSPISIIVSQLASGRILEANEAFLKTYECTRERTIGRTTLELGVFRDPGERELLVARLRAGVPVRDFRVKGSTVSGRAITVLINCDVVEINEEKCILTMVQDITEREAAELALRESEEKFSRAFRSGPNAMAISDFETGRYIEINASFERLFGYRREDALGHTSVELGVWRTAAEREAFMARLADQGSVRDFELETLNRRGEPVIYVVNAEYLTLGGRRCVVMSAQDITARKRAEAERASAVEREMRARAEFTRRLIGAEEDERRRIAAELHDSLGQNLLLLKNRAHLALTDGTVAADLRWQFESIEKMASDAIAEVRQISHDLHPYQLDQLGLTGALEGMIALAGRSSGFPFEQKLEKVDDLFSGEAATHFFRIVQECLNNVLKHSRATGAKVLVERDIHHVRLMVEDDGCGFAHGAEGFGLKSIAERTRILGGSVAVDSAPGRGTRVEVVVPINAEF